VRAGAAAILCVVIGSAVIGWLGAEVWVARHDSQAALKRCHTVVTDCTETLKQADAALEVCYGSNAGKQQLVIP
jgi:hypothetical protein